MISFPFYIAAKDNYYSKTKKYKKMGKKNTLSGKKRRGKLWTLFEDD
jgi:hypothetical protein